MQHNSLNTAVLFLVYNRPDSTKKIFDVIKQMKPRRLYVAADGPKEGKLGDVERVKEVRTIATAVDWPCKVKTIFRDKNLGCKKGVSSAITWFFEHEEQGIILEDDCLPNKSFFWFCEELLNLYKYNEKIYMISGFNKQGQWRIKNQDYFFSFLGGIWGWATWRRAWKHYDIEMTALEYMIKQNLFERQMGKKLGLVRKNELFNAKKRILNGIIDTWDYQWALTRHKYKGISCVPCKNLIQNIGFNENATHTKDLYLDDGLISHEIDFPLKVNHNLNCDKKYDLLFLNCYPFLIRITKKISRIFKLILKKNLP